MHTCVLRASCSPMAQRFEDVIAYLRTPIRCRSDRRRSRLDPSADRDEPLLRRPRVGDPRRPGGDPMSFRFMTWVLDEAPVKDSTQTLVLLCLADYSMTTVSAGRRPRRSSPRPLLGRHRTPNDPQARSDRLDRPHRSQVRIRHKLVPNHQVGGSYPQPPQSATPQQSAGGTPCTHARGPLAPVPAELSITINEPQAAASGGGELDETTNRINELESAVWAAGLTARFDRLSAADRATISSLIDVHGTQALAAHAKALHRPMDPAKFVNAWIEAGRRCPHPDSRPPPRCPAPRAPTATTAGSMPTPPARPAARTSPHGSGARSEAQPRRLHSAHDRGHRIRPVLLEAV